MNRRDFNPKQFLASIGEGRKIVGAKESNNLRKIASTRALPIPAPKLLEISRGLNLLIYQE
jgi:hypothetical protein